MKKLLFLPLLLITCFCLSQDAKEIIGKPVKIGNLLVAQNDFTKAMNWWDANDACAKLGKGWRLPTKDELNVMYKNKEKIGNFANNWYWSFTWIGKNEFGNEEAVMKHFKDGLMSSNEIEYEYSRNAVRAVSDANVASKMDSIKKIIGKPIKIGNLLVAQNDFPEIFTWDDAKKACRNLGKGWRLPTKSELNTLYQNMNKIGGFEIDPGNPYYWSSSSETDLDYAWYQHFINGKQINKSKDRFLFVRAVKSL
jgi:hypothetical protein